MEIFVPSGDTPEGFEFGEEIFGAAAIALQMLVKGWFCLRLVLGGNNGDAAERPGWLI